MTNEELKNRIDNKTLDDNVLILKYYDNKFICNQYIDAIASLKNREKKYIQSIEEIPEDNDFFGVEDNSLYVIDVDKFTEYPDDSYKNLIIVTKSVPDNLTIDYIDMCKIENWQIEAYVQYRLKGLGEREINWLCQVCKYDIYRLDMECRKIEMFPEGSQRLIFTELNMDNGYSDLSDQNIFNFTNAIIKKEYDVIGSLIPEIDSADLEPLGVVTILLNKFKQMVEFLMNPNATPQSVKMTEKQFYFLKNHPDKYSAFNVNEILKNIEFLSEIDYKIKSGNLELTREELLAYIVSHVLS